MAIGLMAATVGAMLVYFYRKGWIRPEVKKSSSSTTPS
jgi:uncharacterized membrane protein